MTSRHALYWANMVGEHPRLVAFLLGDILTRNRPPTKQRSPPHAFVDGRYGCSTWLREAHFLSPWAARLGAMLFRSSRRFWRCKAIQPQKTGNIIHKGLWEKSACVTPHLAQADSVTECGPT